jgi:hypothetical protein
MNLENAQRNHVLDDLASAIAGAREQFDKFALVQARINQVVTTIALSRHCNQQVTHPLPLPSVSIRQAKIREQQTLAIPVEGRTV